MLASFRVIAALATASALAACAPAPPKVAPVPPAAPPATPRAPDASRFHVLMLNGGGTPQINYQSHLLHLRQVQELLLHSGIAPKNISILSSDGPDPKPDLAAKDVQPEKDFWLLEGTRLERRLETPVRLLDSSLPGATLEPATKDNVVRWFEQAKMRLKPGDTLLLYVTDHGTRGGDDPLKNRITLWNNENLEAGELGNLVARLDPGVRVVALMSQCYSGGFASAAAARADASGASAGGFCGYYSSTADRPAYGCFLENRGKENVGHSFHFARALERSHRFADAHAETLATDVTPDVPLRSSDVYLENLLRKAAWEAHVALPNLTDELLRDAFRDRARWEPELRLIDRVAQAFGSFSPRSVAELGEQAQKLPEIASQLDTFTKAWSDALHDGARWNLERFLGSRKDWTERLDDKALAALEPALARTLTGQLLGDLVPFTAADAAGKERLDKLHARAEQADAAAYRMQVRLAVVLRLRALLTAIAGRQYLATQGTAEQRAAYQGLTACEDLTLPGAPLATPAEPTEPYPSFDEEMARAKEVLPGWLGVGFKDLTAEVQQKKNLPSGASAITVVYPDSPAKAAGFEVGDIVLGPPGQPFTGRNQIRAWTMLSPIEQPSPIEILREAQRMTLTVVPKPYPLKWPSLPGPAQVGSLAPKVDLAAFRGGPIGKLTQGTPHLLYFWATWCGPCKAAVPEVLAFEKDKHIPVIAVTDETAEVLNPFFKKWDKPFPKVVAIDEYRKAFQAYGVSGTPTFVWVDAKGTVRGYQVGYSAGKGLNLEGWSWSGRPKGDAPAGAKKP